MRTFDEAPTFQVSGQQTTALAAALWEAEGNNPEDFQAVPSIRVKQRERLEQFMTSEAFQTFIHALVVADRASTLERVAELEVEVGPGTAFSENIVQTLRGIAQEIQLRGESIQN